MFPSLGRYEKFDCVGYTWLDRRNTNQLDKQGPPHIDSANLTRYDAIDGYSSVSMASVEEACNHPVTYEERV